MRGVGNEVGLRTSELARPERLESAPSVFAVESLNGVSFHGLVVGRLLFKNVAGSAETRTRPTGGRQTEAQPLQAY